MINTTRRLLIALSFTSLAAAPALGQVPGESLVFTDRIIAELRVEDGDDAAAIADFIAAFENDPEHPGGTLALLESIPGRPIHLFAATFAPGVEPLAIDLSARYGAFVEEAELLCECDAPEGGTGSTYVDGVGIDPGAFDGQYVRPMLGLDAAHARVTGSNVVVAVLDTGVDVAHAHLHGRIAPGGWNFIDDNADVRDVGDGQDSDGDGVVDELVGHGTFVAGLVSLVAPDATIMPVRVLDGDGVGDAWTVAAGIYHAVDSGADVINLSLRSTLESEVVEAALAEAWNRGLVAVSAAGNFDRSEPEEYPAMDDIVIGVAAVDDVDVKAPFSNFGEDLFISAPGRSLTGADGADPLRSIISTLPGNGYAAWEGTSMATPLVAGAAALVLATHPEWPANAATVDTVRSILAASSVDIDALNPDVAGQLGAGRLDVDAAVSLALSQPRSGRGAAGPSADRFESSASSRGPSPHALSP